MIAIVAIRLTIMLDNIINYINWPKFIELWQYAGMVALFMMWLYITMLCSWGAFRATFTTIWIIINIILILVGSAYVSTII